MAAGAGSFTSGLQTGLFAIGASGVDAVDTPEVAVVTTGALAGKSGAGAETFAGALAIGAFAIGASGVSAADTPESAVVVTGDLAGPSVAGAFAIGASGVCAANTPGERASSCNVASLVSIDTLCTSGTRAGVASPVRTASDEFVSSFFSALAAAAFLKRFAALRALRASSQAAPLCF